MVTLFIVLKVFLIGDGEITFFKNSLPAHPSTLPLYIDVRNVTCRTEMEFDSRGVAIVAKRARRTLGVILTVSGNNVVFR